MMANKRFCPQNDSRQDTATFKMAMTRRLVNVQLTRLCRDDFHLTATNAAQVKDRLIHTIKKSKLLVALRRIHAKAKIETRAE